MNETLKKWALPVVGVIVVLYLLMRASRGGGSQPRTSYLLQSSGGGDASGAAQAKSAAQIAGFQALTTFAGQKLSAETQQKAQEAELTGLRETLTSGQEIERIKGGIQRELGLQNLEALSRQIAGQTEAYRIASADRRYDTDAQLAAIDRNAAAQANLFTMQSKAALDMLLTQINAVSSVGQQYRNQSLERQGTILNSLTGIWGQGQPYSYINAFGGPRPPTFLQQLASAFAQARGAFGGFY